MRDVVRFVAAFLSAGFAVEFGTVFFAGARFVAGAGDFTAAVFLIGPVFFAAACFLVLAAAFFGGVGLVASFLAAGFLPAFDAPADLTGRLADFVGFSDFSADAGLLDFLAGTPAALDRFFVAARGCDALTDLEPGFRPAVLLDARFAGAFDFGFNSLVLLTASSK